MVVVVGNEQDAAFRYLLEGVRDGRLTVEQAMPLIAAVLQPGYRSDQPIPYAITPAGPTWPDGTPYMPNGYTAPFTT
jgi:hypothetical protein